MKRMPLIIIFLLMLSGIAWAQKTPDGFCGLKWGSSREELKKIVPGDLLHDLGGNSLLISPRGWMDRYKEETEKSSWDRLGGAWIVSYEFYFHKNKFYWAIANFSKVDFDILLKTISSKYGSPRSTAPLVLKINPNAKVGIEHIWLLENKVEITLSYNDMENIIENATLQYIYLPIWNEISKAKDKDAEKTRNKL